MTFVVPVHKARKNLSEIMEEAFYLGKPFVLTRGKKAMAAVIGTKEFKRIIALVEKHDPGFADTLAIAANSEIQAILNQGEEDIAESRTLPFDKHLLK